MFLLFLKSQLSLLDKLVTVHGHTTKDGTVVATHTAHRKVALVKPKASAPVSGDLFAPPQKSNTSAEPVQEKPKPEHEPSRVQRRRGARSDAASIEGRYPDLFDILERVQEEPTHEPKPPVPVSVEVHSEPNQSATPHAQAPETFGVHAGISKAERREINARVAARLLDGGPYDTDDLRLFSQYSGNGGCGDSLNEFYTDPEVAQSMWAALRSLGFSGGTALEPSAGTGVFLHTAPDDVRFTAIELETVSHEACRALFGDKHETVQASLERFATSDDRQFDLVIGNPPYGDRGGFVRYDKRDISRAEQYFTDTALDKCKPGGFIALVVPTGIIDAKNNRSFRQSILCKGEFLGAQRMPNTAFEHSHTEVTTDVIYLRKRPDDVAGALAALGQKSLKALGVWDEEFLAGAYFSGRGADNVLGSMEAGWRAKAGMGNDITVEGSMADVPARLAAFRPNPVGASALSLTVQQVIDSLHNEELERRALSGAQNLPYAAKNKLGDTKVVDGVTYILQGDPPRWHTLSEFLQTKSVASAQDIAAEIENLLTGVVADRPKIEADIRAYVAAHGIPAENPDLLLAARTDKTLYRLIGAVDHAGNLSDAVLGMAPHKIEGGFDTNAEILSLEHEDGFIAEALADRLGRPLHEVCDQLAADDRYAVISSGRWTLMDTYLTGELWPKLDAAREQLASGDSADLKAKLDLQIGRLESVIDPKSLDDVEVTMASAFIPTHIIGDFLTYRNRREDANKWQRDLPPVHVGFENGVYYVTGGNTWGDTKLVEKYLNRSGVKKDERGDVDALNDEFKLWLCSSSYRDQVEEDYNRKFRGFVAPRFSDEPMAVPGLTTDRDVRSWRWSSLRRSLTVGKGIIADDVGLGKTLGGLLLARMSKVQGAAKRPVTVVPKSVLANWYEESQTWFPGSRVLTIGANFSVDKDGKLIGKDDSADERKRKYHDLTQNDYDFVFISEPAFEEVDLNPITKEEYYSKDFWVQRGEALGAAGDKRRKAIKEAYDRAIAQREFSGRTDAIYFDDLGIDMLIADEMHHQKNLYAAKNRFGESPKFLGGQGLSMRALDFNLKARFILDHNGGKNVHGLTATPTKNSPLEIYSMLSHIAPEAFEKIGIRNSEEFLDRFCEFTPDKVYTTSGDIEEATVVSGFKNLGELREIMSRYIDRRTAEQVGLKLPERDDRMHLVDMSDDQEAEYVELRALAAQSGKKDAEGDAHIFAIMDKMNKAALDLELLNPAAHKGAKSPKYATLADECWTGAKDGGQIVFCEYVDSHEKIAAALVDRGFKRDEIGIINAKVAPSAIKRQNIAAALNSGKLKAVIGNATMAEGLNMQKTTTDIHHMDVPWEPATLQQRNGRGLRQGNMNEALRIHTYLSKGSFDGYRYQSVAAKKDWQDLLWNGGDRVENLAREGAFSREDMLIMLSPDPDAARASMESNKEAAKARFDAGRRKDAQADYVRFVELSHSYKGLKNKESQSARRLKQKIEAAKSSLKADEYFPDKGALETLGDVILHPATGEALAADHGLMIDGQKSVVSSVDMRRGTFTIRKYADTTGAGTVTLPITRLDGSSRFDFDPNVEAEEVATNMASAAEEQLGNLTSWEQIKKMPPSVLERNGPMIQEQIKAGSKSYKFSMPYGDVTMIDKGTGKLKVVSSYEHNKLHDTHDYALPTPENRQKAEDAWVESERGAHFSIDSVVTGKGRSAQSKSVRVRAYPDASSSSGRNRNPYSSILAGMHGQSSYTGLESAAERAGYKRMTNEQLGRIRHAPSGVEAIRDVLPLGKIEGGQVKYPKEALMLAWAQARRLGQLDSALPNEKEDRNYKYAYGGAHNVTLHSALIRMALNSGHPDLAEAFTEASERHGLSKVDGDTLSALSQNLTLSPRTLGHIKAMAERLGIMDRTVSDVASMNLRGHFMPSYGFGSSRPKTIGAVIKERMESGK